MYCLHRQTRAWSIFMFFMVLILFHRAGAKCLCSSVLNTCPQNCQTLPYGRARLGCNLRPRLMQLDKREMGNQAGGSRRYSANFFPVPFSVNCLGISGSHVLACLLQSAQTCLSDGQVFFLRCSCSYTRRDSPRLWRSCAARDQCDARHWQRASLVAPL